MIVDNYALDVQWESEVLDNISAVFDQVPSIMIIDDLANRTHLADILLDQNFFGSAAISRYQNLIPQSCNLLLGPHYALLSAEYSLLRTAVVPKQELRRVVVYFGGSDLYQCSLLTVKALAQEQFRHLQIDVIIGPNASGYEQILAIAQRFSNIRVHKSMPSLAGMFLRADLAIGAGGVTTWERCCLSLPSIVITIADNQIVPMSYLSRNNSIKLLGSAEVVSEDDIRFAVVDFQECIATVSTGEEYVGGFGVPLVSNSLLGIHSTLSFRAVKSTDKHLLWRWANDAAVRSNSFSPDFISLSDHETWFTTGLNSSDRLHWIAMDIHQCPVGQIRFDRSHENQTILIDFSLDSAVRGQGLGSNLLLNSIGLISPDWKNNYKIMAQVQSSNLASQACFQKAGFKLIDSSNEGVSTWLWE